MCITRKAVFDRCCRKKILQVFLSNIDSIQEPNTQYRFQGMVYCDSIVASWQQLADFFDSIDQKPTLAVQ